jgi:hypothetical protein
VTPRSSWSWVVLGVCAALVLAGSAATRPAAPGPLHIHALTGSVRKLGSWGSGGTSHPLLGVRLRAAVCLSSPAEAQNSYPSEVRITHFAVSKSPMRWWPARTVIDRAPWLVPFGEGWGDSACGVVTLEDLIPPEHYGVESLGNPKNCYGVSLTIKVRGRQASKRAIITCRFGR